MFGFSTSISCDSLGIVSKNFSTSLNCIEFKLSTKSSNNFVESSKRITKIPHPELLEVKPGDELMVVNFKEQDQSDPIYKSLQERIDELTEEEDEDDDDGDVVVRT